MCVFSSLYLQGKVEAQGTYQDILSSGIDYASILATSDNADDEHTGELAPFPRCNSFSPSNRSTVSMKALAIGKCTDDKNANELEEEHELLSKLEETSKGKVKGPLLLKYLQSAKRPITLVFLIVTIFGTQMLASAADIWGSYW